MQAKQQRDLLEKKVQIEREKPFTVHVIKSVAELDQVFADIDDSGESASKKCKKKLAVVKEQVCVRKKVLSEHKIHQFRKESSS